MLRRRKFSRVESIIVRGFVVALLAAGLVGLFLALDRADWRIALGSVGVLVIGAIYLLAAKRGKPL